MKRLFRNSHTGDAALRAFLKRYDPIAPLPRSFLGTLETDIFARIDAVSLPAAEDGFLPAWMCDRAWSRRAAVFVVMLIVLSGFVAGRMSYRPAPDSAALGLPSLMAFADESLPDASWGDDDDN